MQGISRRWQTDACKAASLTRALPVVCYEGARKDQTPAAPGTNFAVCRHGDAQRAAFVTLATHDYSQGALVLTVGLWGPWDGSYRSTAHDSLDGNLFLFWPAKGWSTVWTARLDRCYCLQRHRAFSGSRPVQSSEGSLTHKTSHQWPNLQFLVSDLASCSQMLSRFTPSRNRRGVASVVKPARCTSTCFCR